MTDLATYERDVLANVQRRLRAVLEFSDRSAGDIAGLGSPEDVAEAMVAALPTAHPLDSAVGPFYDTAGLTAWLGVTRQALNKQVHAHRLLAVRTADGATLYPAWQFTPAGATIPGLDGVLAALAEGTDDTWMVALWLRAPHSELGGRSPSEHLAGGRDVAPVVRAARAVAGRWR